METPAEVAAQYGQTELATLLRVMEAVADGRGPGQATADGVDVEEFRACLDFVAGRLIV